MANIPSPNVATRSDTTWWAAPIGAGEVHESPVFTSDLPTADPHVVGQLWSNSGVVTQSAG